MSTIEFSDYLTVATAAQAAGVSERRIIAFINEGRLAAKRFSRAWLIPKSDFAEFLSIPRENGNPNFLGKNRKSKKSGKKS